MASGNTDLIQPYFWTSSRSSGRVKYTGLYKSMYQWYSEWWRDVCAGER